MFIPTLFQGLRPASSALLQCVLLNVMLFVIASLPAFQTPTFAHVGALITANLVLNGVLLWNAYKPRESLSGPSIISCLNSSIPRSNTSYQLVDLVDELEQLASISRRHGLVALERVLANHEVSHPFLEYGLLMAIEHKSKDALLTSLHVHETTLLQEAQQRILVLQQAFKPMMPLATAINAVGVLISLNISLDVSVLNALFLNTLMAWGMVYTILQPMVNRFIAAEKDEAKARQLIRLGVLSLWEQEHPNALRQRLNSYITPSQRIKHESTAWNAEEAPVPVQH
jgi:chemotaxis protein MotA